jgi:hypothetical protein
MGRMAARALGQQVLQDDWKMRTAPITNTWREDLMDMVVPLAVFRQVSPDING